MPIYTRSGDKGKTHVIGGVRSKDDLRVEAYGTIDETNAFVGQAIALLDPAVSQDMIDDLTAIQHELFDCGGDLATLPGNKHPYRVTSEMVDRLEPLIDKYMAECPPIRRFILPGGHAAAAALHVCRTVARRAERRVVSLAASEEINMEVLRYLNRLSDFFFAIARAVNARYRHHDVEYVRSADVFRD
jgi:cob(I)alamin adenosyltransferase